MEGLRCFVEEHLFITFGIIFVLFYIEYIIIKLWNEGKIIPIYKRPFPKNREMFIKSLNQDIANFCTVLEELLPWKTVFIFLFAILFLLSFSVFSFISIIITISIIPPKILAGFLLFRYIF